MNVLVASPDLKSGGVACVVRNLTQYLRSNGHKVQIFHSGSSIIPRLTPGPSGSGAIDLRLQMPFGERNAALSLILFAVLFPIGLLQLAWLIWRRRIQVVNIHYPARNLFYFAVCRRIFRFTLVCSFHGADLFPNGKRQAKYHWGIRMLLRRSDRIVTPSEDFRRKLVDVFPDCADKTVAIHNGINLEEISALPVLPDTEAAARGRYILSVSAYKDQKGLDVLIRAMKQVSRQNPDIRLVLVGEGDLREQLESLSVELGLADRIEFNGRKSQAEVAALLRGCEVFVLPSRFETFGIAILEAMAWCRPVVVANTGGMPEIVRNGHNGLTVERDDPSGLASALTTLLNDSALRYRLGQSGFEDVRRHFDVSSMGKGYEKAFGLAATTISRVQTDCEDRVIPGVGRS